MRAEKLVTSVSQKVVVQKVSKKVAGKSVTILVHEYNLLATITKIYMQLQWLIAAATSGYFRIVTIWFFCFRITLFGFTRQVQAVEITTDDVFLQTSTSLGWPSGHQNFFKLHGWGSVDKATLVSCSSGLPQKKRCPLSEDNVAQHVGCESVFVRLAC